MARVFTGNTRFITEGAKNGIALPLIRVDSVDYNLEELSRADLIDLAALIKADIDNIQFQLDSGHTGSWARPGWEASATFARNMKSTQVQLIQAELGRRKEKVNPLSQFFMDRAWEVLAQDLFESISAFAKDRQREALAGV